PDDEELLPHRVNHTAYLVSSLLLRTQLLHAVLDKIIGIQRGSIVDEYPAGVGVIGSSDGEATGRQRTTWLHLSPCFRVKIKRPNALSTPSTHMTSTGTPYDDEPIYIRHVGHTIFGRSAVRLHAIDQCFYAGILGSRW